MDDIAETVNKARNGDSDAFGRLFEKYKLFVWNVAFRMTYDFDEAEDLAQDVFVTVWESLDSFRGDSRFSTWIYRITVNKALNRLRQSKNRFADFDGAMLKASFDEAVYARQNPAVRAEEMESEKTLAGLLSRLDADQRMTVILREIEGLSYEEIAEVTGVPVGTVRSRLSRGRRELERMAGKLT